MKRIFALLTFFFATFGIAKAQDVYFSGNYNATGKIWKNNTLAYNLSDSINVQLKDLQVADGGIVYSAGYVGDSASGCGRVWRDDSCIFTSVAGTGINCLFLNDSAWMAAGGNTVWHNGEVLYSYSVDTTSACIINALDIDNSTDDLYAGGVVVTPGVYACVWKNDAVYWQSNGLSKINDLCVVGNNIFAAGFINGAETNDGIIWQNDSIIFQTEQGDITIVTSYGGSIYWSGIAMDTVYIWQDGEVLYALPEVTAITSLVVNEFGVYYAGVTNGVPTVWKDGAVLYQPEDCQNITSLAVLPSETPQPAPEIRLLPWFDGFETDSTDWAEWTILDFDGNTDIGWERTNVNAATGDFSARHLACDNIQEGWLITPAIYLTPYCDSAWMSFKTMEANHQNHTSSQLLISTTGTEISQFSEIWSQENPSEAWDTVRLDLSEYLGDTIRLAFKYSGHHGHDWYIDDVNVEEALTLYNITVESDHPEWGSVSGSGAYPYGDTIQIEALPNIGHQFLTWDDGNTNNPRDIIITQDSTFIASFAVSQFTITVESDHPAWGSVTGGGTYYYGDTIEIAASSNLGFEFVSWDDGIADNPRTIIVTEDHHYIAQFRVQQCLIKTEVTPEGAGTVEGGGTYDYNTTIHLVAHNNTGYSFEMWSDGNITNPRTVIVEGNATYTAVFTPHQFEITTESDPVEGGTVTGAGTYAYGSTATLTATPSENYTFLCWQDGIVSNPRNVTVTQNANYRAMFHLNGTPQYTITVTSNDPGLGNVTGSGTYPEGSTIEISARPNTGVHFTGWDDGNTDNPRSIVVTQNMEFMAIFTEAETYTITVRSASPLLGSTYGSGIYPVNQVVTIGATPNNGIHFSGWQDGDMNNPRTIIVTGDAEYTASFSHNPVETYTVTVYFDENQGFVIGAGTYSAGATATLAAIPADDYQFTKWSDGTTDNPKEIVVDHDIVLAAFFGFTSVDENGTETLSLYPNPAKDKIRIEGIEGQHEIQIYNAMGMLVKATNLHGSNEICIEELPSGLYIIRISGHAVRFIKQ